jgi:serine/threonine protein kinase
VKTPVACLKCNAGFEDTADQTHGCLLCGGPVGTPLAESRVPVWSPGVLSPTGPITISVSIDGKERLRITFRQDFIEVGRPLEGIAPSINLGKWVGSDRISRRALRFVRRADGYAVRFLKAPQGAAIDGVAAVEWDQTRDTDYPLRGWERIDVAPGIRLDLLGNVQQNPGEGWSRNVSYGVVEFRRDDPAFGAPDVLRLPSMIGGRYAVESVLSTAGGFGAICTALDRRLANRRVLVKARRNDMVASFRMEIDAARSNLVCQRRKQIEFEWVSLLMCRMLGETRVPCLSAVCRDESPELRGPHLTSDDPPKEWWCDDVEVVGKEPYLIMQWIDGVPVDHRLDEQRRDPHWEVRVLRLALEISRMLETLHQLRKTAVPPYYFIYQDLKPANILQSYAQIYTLIDFGGVLLVQETQQGPYTAPGLGGPLACGTRGYQPPELDPRLRRSHMLDRRVDVYGLGATLFHLLSGVDPRELPLDLAYGPLPVDRLPATLSTRTQELVIKALKPIPSERYDDISQMKEAIQEALSAASR